MNTSGRALTAEDILAPGFERGELWDGVFVVREPSGGWAGTVGSRVNVLLASSVERSRGWAFDASQGFVVSREPDRVLSPDYAVLTRDRLRVPPERGFVEGPPELAVEIRSPTDSWTSVVEKGGVWIGHGVRVVWCIDPSARLVVVMRPGEEPEEIGPDESASARPVLDCEIDVAALFTGLA